MDENFEQPQSKRTTLSPEKLLERKKEYLKTLKVLRFDYIEEFPLEKLLPDMPNYDRYKCRTAFFTTIAAIIQGLQDKGLINNSETKEECEEFFKFCDSIRATERFYTQEDVDKGNRMLDFLIKELSV